MFCHTVWEVRSAVKCCLSVLRTGRRPLQDLVDDLLDFVQEYVIPDVRLRHEKHTGTQQLQKGRSRERPS